MKPFPDLFADGVHDDTAAIQARLDSGMSCVYLPPTPHHYVISKPLRLGSDQELKLDRFTRIRLAPHSDCVMLTNRDYEKGNSRCALTGGIWDFDNLNQGPNFMCQHVLGLPAYKDSPYYRVFLPDRYRAEAIYFQNVSNMTVKGITIRNPGTYAIQFCKLSYFVIDDVEFDFTTCNPAKANMDGVHLDGACHHGKISNIRGTCYDDMIALNANDGACTFEEGPITDIDIDGVYCEYCHSAVRLLSTGADIRRVTIRHVHGNFYRYGVGLTHFFRDRKTRGVFDDIVIEDCFMAKARQPEDLWELLPVFPMIYCDDRIDVGKLSIVRLCRDEKTLPEAAIEIMPDCRIGNLSITDCKQVNRLDVPLTFLWNKGLVDHMEFRNNELVSAPGMNIDKERTESMKPIQKRRTSSTKRKSIRFTLIELLVVIAIIAILAGMLLPALGEVKKTGNRIHCLNSQKTILMGEQLYLSTYDDFLMPTILNTGGTIFGATNKWLIWSEQIQLLLNPKNAPTIKDANNYWLCPAEPVKLTNQTAGGYKYGHLALNSVMGGIFPDQGTATVPYSKKFRKASVCKIPSVNMICTDSSQKDDYRIRIDFGISVVAFRHGRGYNPNIAQTGDMTNVGYLDGHVASEKIDLFQEKDGSFMKQFLVDRSAARSAPY